jgi:hypothetical protein
MGWKIEFEKRIDDLNHRVRTIESLLKELSKPKPKKKPVKKAKSESPEAIAEA